MRASILTKVCGTGNSAHEVNCLLKHLFKNAPCYSEVVSCKNSNCVKYQKEYVRKFGLFSVSNVYEHDLNTLPIAIESNLPLELVCKVCSSNGEFKRSTYQHMFIEV